MKKANLKAVLSTAIVCFVFWLLITEQLLAVFEGHASVQVLVAGLLVSCGAALFSARFFIHEDPFHLYRRLPAFFSYCFVTFPKELWKANVDVAKRALDPKLPINPGIVKVPVRLTSEYGQAMLADSITLTPGTITMDIAEENGSTFYYIHWIDVQTDDPEEAGNAIKGVLEDGTRRIWE